MYAHGTLRLLVGDNWSDIMYDIMDGIIAETDSPWSLVTGAGPTPVALQGFANSPSRPDSSPTNTEHRTMYYNTDPNLTTMMRFTGDTDGIHSYIGDLTSHPTGFFSYAAVDDWMKLDFDISSTASAAQNTIFGNWVSGNIIHPYQGYVHWWVHDEMLIILQLNEQLGVLGGTCVWLKYLNGSTIATTPREPGSPMLVPNFSFTTAGWRIAGYYPASYGGTFYPYNTSRWYADHVGAGGGYGLTKAGEYPVGDVSFSHPGTRYTVTGICPYIKFTSGGLATEVLDTRTFDGVGYQCFYKTNIACWVATEAITLP